MARFTQSLIGPATAIALAAAALIPAVGGWQIMRDRSATIADARQSVKTLGHALAEQAVAVVQHVDMLLSETVEHVESGTDRTTIDAFVKGQSQMGSRGRFLAVIDATGDLVAYEQPFHAPVSLADRAYFTWHRDHADSGLHFDQVLMTRVDKRLLIPLSRRIVDRDGAFAGVAVAGLLPEDFQTFYDELEVGPHGVVALWSTDATLLVRRPKVDASSSGPLRSSTLARFGPERSGVLETQSSIDGVNRILAFERVGDYPLVLSVAFSVDDVLRVWGYESSIQGSVLALASLALVLLALRLERSRRIAKQDSLLRQDADRRYRLLAQNASDLVLLKTRASDTLSYVSPSSVDMLGWRPDELAAIAIPSLVHPEDLQTVISDLASLSAERSSLTSVHRLRHKAGHYIRVEARLRWAAADPNDGAIIMAARDVTARYAAEERYRMLADSTSDVIAQLDLDLTRRYVSPSCFAMLGYEPEALIGGQPADTMHPHDIEQVKSLCQRLAAGAVVDDRIMLTYRFRHRQGHWVWIEAAVSLVRDPGKGAPASLICSLRDVGERQRAARDLERAKEAAENAARVKSDFVANMSHELRTPLTGILGIHDLLLADPMLDNRQRRYVGMAHESGRSLLAIVNDVLDFSKIEAGELVIDAVAFDLGALVDTCLALGRETAAKKGLSIEARMAGMIPTLHGDPNRLRQVLLNLLTNAIKFTDHGWIGVEATYDRKASVLRIRVSDTGVGILPEKLALLFDRFTQADTSITRRHGGTGLGLAISKHLVELMGGVIGVESEFGQGSAFWFELPLAEARHAIASPHIVLPAVRDQPLRVLLAEDNDVNQDIIAAMLESRGHAVTIVDNGAAAVAALSRGVGFDVVLMDLQMPVMDGLSATQAIRARERASASPPITIFGLTANAMTADVERCLAGGMDGHISKPIEWDTLFAAIARIERSDARPVAAHAQAYR